MRSILFLTILFLDVFFSIGQSHTVTSTIQRTNLKYRSALHCKNNVYAIAESGHVVVWSLQRLDTIPFPKHDTATFKFLCAGKDRNDVVYFGTDKGHIFKYDAASRKYSLYKKIEYSVYDIVFNTDDRLLVIVRNGVYDPLKKKRWSKFGNHTNDLIVKKRVLGVFAITVHKYFEMPQYTFLDSQDRLWMTTAFGEFGGDVQIFDTKKLRIVNNRFDSISTGFRHPKSVFEGLNREIFLTSGLEHFYSSGEIYRIDPNRTVTRVFHSSGPPVFEAETNKMISEGGVFVGPGAFNKQDSCIYFATSRGIHKIKMNRKRSDVAEMVANPSLHWENEPLAIGAAMSIKRMEFLPDGRLLFLTSMDGIGVFDGAKITLLR